MKRKYVPDLTRQMAQCEANYARMLKLLPDLDTRDVREFQVCWRQHQLVVRLHLRVAHGLPIAEVARQVDHAVRHAVRVALNREVDQLSIRVARLELHPGGEPPQPSVPAAVTPSDLADSGTDVA